MKKYVNIIIFIFCCSSILLASDDWKTDDNPLKLSDQILTEKEALQAALKNSRNLESFNTAVQIAQYRLNSSGWIRNPEFRVRDVSTKYYTEGFDEIQYGLRWRFPSLGELGERKQDARVRLSERQVQAIRYQNQVIVRVRKSWANVLFYDQLTNLEHERLSLENQRISVIEKMVEIGERTIVYFTKAKMWFSQSQNDYIRTLQKQRLERRQLSKRSGIPEDIQLAPQNIAEVKVDLDTLISIALKNRPEINFVEQRIILAEKQEKLELYKLFPWPSFVEVSYHREKKRLNDWGELMFGINLPIFNLNLGNIKATDLGVKRKQDELDAIREEIEYEVRDAYNIYMDLLLDWKNYNREAKRMIENAKEVIEQAKIHETLMSDEVFEMELTIIETEKILAEKQRDLAHALFDLYFVLGIEDPKQLMN